MLLFKGTFGHVESSLDKPAENFPVQLRFFSGQRPRKTKNKYFKSFFDVFISVHLVSVSTRLNIFLPKSEKTSLKIPKEMMIV